MMRIVLDAEKCVGCRTCEGVCCLANEGEANPMKSRIRVVRTIRDQIRYAIPVFCQQCEDAACEAVCPRRAIVRDPRGVLMVDEEKCVGCKLCEIACPVGAITVNPDTRVSMKCTQCAAMEEPQCVKHCYSEALRFVPAERAGLMRARAKAEKFLDLERRA